MMESVFIALISGVIGLLAAQAAIPLFNGIIGKNIIQSVFENVESVVLIAGVTIITGIFSGIYPAFVISHYNPVKALKQKYVQDESRGVSLKKVLVTGQFSISIFLLIVSFIIYRQTHYLMNRDLGFDPKSMLFANIVTDKSGSFDPVRERLLKHPEITDACFSDYIPFILPGGGDLNWEGANPEERVFVRISNISYDFVNTFGMKMAEGRNFSREYPSDAGKCLINETAFRVFGWDDPIGKHIHHWKGDIEVIGVIKDYFPYAVHNPIEPHMYFMIPDSAALSGVYTIKYSPGNEKPVRQWVKEEFENSFPDDAFEFMDFRSLIINENSARAWSYFRNICIFFASLSILISSIGLFGLIMFYAKRKMKEIGIRKVLGFSTTNLYFTLSSEFIKLLLISMLIAWPASFYLYRILPGAYKYPLQVWEFLTATLIVLLVALATISYQIILASGTSPVEVLKEE
jgi:putative ABC transport system permease protein